MGILKDTIKLLADLEPDTDGLGYASFSSDLDTSLDDLENSIAAGDISLSSVVLAADIITFTMSDASTYQVDISAYKQTLTQTTVDVDVSFIAGGEPNGDANASNTIVSITGERLDTGWSLASNAYTYTGNPDHIVITANMFFEDPQTGLRARIQPVLELLKNGAVIATTANTYQRHATGHNSSSHSLSFIDMNPSSGDNYSLRTQQGSNQNDVVNIDDGKFSLKAVEKQTVLLSSVIST